MTLTATPPTELVDLSSIKTVKQVPYTEYFVSGHRTCQGCESALVMRYIAKAAGPRTIVMGSTGCMYVANTSYYTTPWVVPWMHTQLGSAGSAALGAAAGLKVLMRKGKLADEPINVIAFCGDGGGADMGLSAISAALTHADYRVLDHPVRQRVVRQYRYPGVRLLAVRRGDDVLADRQDEAPHAHALEEEHAGRAGGGPS